MTDNPIEVHDPEYFSLSCSLSSGVYLLFLVSILGVVVGGARKDIQNLCRRMGGIGNFFFHLGSIYVFDPRLCSNSGLCTRDRVNLL